MVDKTRREILKTGAAATVAAAASKVFAQQSGPKGKFYEKGPVRITTRKRAKAPGDSRRRAELDHRRARQSFSPMDVLSNEPAPSSDLRNANNGQSSGPVDVDRPWDSYRRSPRADGSSGHRQVHGDRLLHRRPFMEPPETRQMRRRGRARAAERIPSGDADALLRQQHYRLGTHPSSSVPRSRRRRWRFRRRC